jgi:hypothetical protein
MLPTTTRRLRGSLLRVVSGLGSELVERDVCREQLVDGIRLTVELSERGDREPWTTNIAERGDREPRTTNIADHGHDLDRLAICVLLVPFADEQAAARERREAAQRPVGQRNRWTGGLVWSFGQVGHRARRSERQRS